MLKGKSDTVVKQSVFQPNKKIYLFLTGMTVISLVFYFSNYNSAIKATVKQFDFIEYLRMKNVLGVYTTTSLSLTDSKADESHITRQSTELGRSISSTEKSARPTTVYHPVSNTGKPKHIHGSISPDSELNRNTESEKTVAAELESIHSSESTSSESRSHSSIRSSSSISIRVSENTNTLLETATAHRSTVRKRKKSTKAKSTTRISNVSSTAYTRFRSKASSIASSQGYHNSSAAHTPSTSQSSVSSPKPMKYLVNSESCKIPDYDPFHPSLRKYIEYNKPLDCSDYPALTYTDGNVLMVNVTVARLQQYKSFTCCYRALYRDGNGKSDEKYKISSTCNPVYKVTNISDEFIKVECQDYANGSVIYRNFHSFIQEKPAVEKRCEDSAGEYSILILGMDCMSRMNMHRQLRETVAYLYKNLDPVEMYGYNKVGDNTFPNLIPLLTGYSDKELSESCWEKERKPLDDCDFIWKTFAEKGYRTLFAEDCYYISTFNYASKVGFYKQPVDYYFRPFIKAYEQTLGRRKKLNTRLCLGPVSQVQATLHWIKEFALRFKNKRYFSFSWINTYTHDFMNAGSAVDTFYADFFRVLHTSGALDDTIVIFLSDHGMRWGGVRKTHVGRLEEKLPMLLIMLPKRFRESHPEEARNLSENSHRLVTPFDLHATLQHLLHIDEKWESLNTSSVPSHIRSVFRKRAQSLLLPVSEDRSCEDAHIKEHFCTCVSYIQTDPDSRDVRSIAAFLVYELNGILSGEGDCARLELNDIVQSSVKQSSSKRRSNNAYTLIIQTTPGYGLFEGTVRFKNGNELELLGDISRLNMYGNQSACVDDAFLKKYCYCV